MWKKWMMLVFFWIGSCEAGYEYELSICMIFRDEAPYLKEWIEFHRLMGVQHFYLCNHNSQDNYREVLRPYIATGIVELKELRNDSGEDLPGFNQLQLNVYNQALKKAKGISRWVAFIDSDEFLFPTQSQSLIQLLKAYRDVGGVTANWKAFGTSGVDRLKQDELLIEHLTSCAPTHWEFHRHIKSIVQPKRVSYFENPHYAIYLPGYAQVNTDGEVFEGAFSPSIQMNQMRINHYWTRDEHYFWNYKVPRQVKWCGSNLDKLKGLLNQFNQETDITIHRFLEKLKKRMSLKHS